MGHCTVLLCPTSRTWADRSAVPGSAPATRTVSTGATRNSPSLLKWLISLLVCCWGSRPQQSPSGDSDSESDSSDAIELGPMTLREYINTLEPYNPEVHGWRGDEPRRRTNSCLYVNGPRCHSPPNYAYSSISYQPRTGCQRNQVV